MGTAPLGSEPVLFCVTAAPLPALLVLVACLGLGLVVVALRVGPRFRARRPARQLLSLLGVCLGAGALWAAVQLAAPAVLLKATEQGVTSYLTGLPPRGRFGLPFSGPSSADGVFIPWKAVEGIGLERVEAYLGSTRARPCDVLVFRLRPGFQELTSAGLVVAPGVRRWTLDLPVPIPGQGAAVLAELQALQQRFSAR
ncbi:MAG: hypothetical protein ACLQDQ_12005 [Myxococcaceae bacterium]